MHVGMTELKLNRVLDLARFGKKTSEQNRVKNFLDRVGFLNSVLKFYKTVPDAQLLTLCVIYSDTRTSIYSTRTCV